MCGRQPGWPAGGPVQRPAGPGILLLTGLTATVPGHDARLPPDRTPSPGKQPAPPADPRHCARRAGPGRGRHDRPMITNTDHKSRAQNRLPRLRAHPGRSTCHPPGPPRRPRPQPLVAVAAAVFLLRRVAGCGQVGDDAVGAALGAARPAAMSRSRTPGSRAMRSSTRAWLVRTLQLAPRRMVTISRNLLLVSNCEYRLRADTRDQPPTAA